MNEPRTTLLITLTGRDRPGVTSRLFSVLARFPLSVVDIEQVVIRGRLVLGVLTSCDEPPDLTAIHRSVTSMAAGLGLDAEITTGSAEPGQGGAGYAAAAEQLHVTVLGHPLLPNAVAAVAGRIAGERRQHRPHHPAGQRPGHLHRARRFRGRARPAAGRAGAGGRG